MEQEDIFRQFCNIIAQLRDPQNGCPWDKEQTSSTLKDYILEEAYETVEAIGQNDPEHLKEELGDLLLQIILQSQIASEGNLFTIDDVISNIKEKIIRRHPHVFGDKSVNTAEGVEIQWDKIKQKEKKRESVLDSVPKILPALRRAYELQRKAAKVGFDWEQHSDVLLKIEEELGELREEIANNNKEKIEKELGDLLFAIVNWARWIEIDVENSLNLTNKKFIARFRWMENKLKGSPLDHNLSIQEWDELWESSKKYIK